ncbi:helix-turn-helix domain-containing protein [Fibrivirga algicola]|uniref:Helix-turn-helix domain-containing protein n=1 Tax=Fibrivirga algicola TaxID=2950420 RepID=A0ABX0QRI7_9BACT|nr:helix-turn-helix domain-containing protein [Fibrivirga algicola]NID13363.1 helix-turn-helix domain-containing protein [Fibrivirga algicola]
MSTIHETIKAIRTEKGLKQEEVASKLSMAQSNYARLEKGLTQVTVDRLEQLGNVFEMSIAAILSYEVGQQQPTREDIEYYINLCKKYEKQISTLKARITELEEESIDDLVNKSDEIKYMKGKQKEISDKLKQKEKDFVEKLIHKDQIIEEKNRTIALMEMTIRALSKDSVKE